MRIVKRLSVLFCSAVLLFVACGVRQSDQLSEEARFALDNKDYATAITKATDLIAQNPNDFDAAMLLSSAYAGRAGVNLFNISKKLLEAGIETQAFNAVHDILVTTIGSAGLADLRTAVTTLSSFAGTVTEREKFTFQLGILETIEAFGRPSITAQPTVAGTITVTNINGTDASFVQSDLVDADNHLITSGIKSDSQLITTIRKSFCVMKNRSASSGFTTAEMQDRVRCELDENRANLLATNGDFQSPATVTTCADFNFNACTAVDTTP